MVEISLYGSGEGPGWVTAPGYSTGPLSARGPITRCDVKQRSEGFRPRSGPISSPAACRGLARRACLAGRQPAGRSPGTRVPDGIGLRRHGWGVVAQASSGADVPLGRGALVELERGPEGVGLRGAGRFVLRPGMSPAEWPAPRERGSPRRQVQAGEDPPRDVGLCDRGEYAHASATAWAAQGIHREDPLQEV